MDKKAKCLSCHVCPCECVRERRVCVQPGERRRCTGDDGTDGRLRAGTLSIWTQSL